MNRYKVATIALALGAVMSAQAQNIFRVNRPSGNTYFWKDTSIWQGNTLSGGVVSGGPQTGDFISLRSIGTTLLTGNTGQFSTLTERYAGMLVRQAVVTLDGTVSTGSSGSLIELTGIGPDYHLGDRTLGLHVYGDGARTALTLSNLELSSLSEVLINGRDLSVGQTAELNLLGTNTSLVTTLNAPNVTLTGTGTRFNVSSATVNAQEIHLSSFGISGYSDSQARFGTDAIANFESIRLTNVQQAQFNLSDNAQVNALTFSGLLDNTFDGAKTSFVNITDQAQLTVLPVLDSSGTGFTGGQAFFFASDGNRWEINQSGQIRTTSLFTSAVGGTIEYNLTDGGYVDATGFEINSQRKFGNAFFTSGLGGTTDVTIENATLESDEVGFLTDGASGSATRAKIKSGGLVLANFVTSDRADTEVQSGGAINAFSYQAVGGGETRILSGGTLEANLFLTGYKAGTSVPTLSIQGQANAQEALVGNSIAGLGQSGDSLLRVGSGGTLSLHRLGIGTQYSRTSTGTVNNLFTPDQLGSVSLVNGGRAFAGDRSRVIDATLEASVAVASGATLSVDGTSAMNIGGNGQEAYINGAIQLSPAAAGDNRAGYLVGNGTINANVVNNGGFLLPGFSPGRLIINGDYLQNAGTLEFEIGGTTAGTLFDQLQVSGDVRLNGGRVKIKPINDYFIPAGTEFALFTGFRSLSVASALQFDIDPRIASFAFDPLTGRATMGSVPEPASFLALAAGLGFIARRRKRA